jgi:hypothetical protein
MAMVMRVARWSTALRLPLRQPRRAFSLAAPGQPPYRVLFFGTDDISLATLRRLHANSQEEDAGARLVEHVEVVCPSDRKVGRAGARNEPVPVKKFALRHGLPVVHTPPHLCVLQRSMA